MWIYRSYRWIIIHDTNDKTHIRHGQLLVESNVYLVSDCYAEREHSHKHSDLENTKHALLTYYQALVF